MTYNYQLNSTQLRAVTDFLRAVEDAALKYGCRLVAPTGAMEVEVGDGDGQGLRTVPFQVILERGNGGLTIVEQYQL